MSLGSSSPSATIGMLGPDSTAKPLASQRSGEEAPNPVNSNGDASSCPAASLLLYSLQPRRHRYKNAEQVHRL